MPRRWFALRTRRCRRLPPSDELRRVKLLIHRIVPLRNDKWRARLLRTRSRFRVYRRKADLDKILNVPVGQQPTDVAIRRLRALPRKIAALDRANC
jgi:hypothetical protein